MIRFRTWGEFDEWWRYREEWIVFPLSIRMGQVRWFCESARGGKPYEIANCIEKSESRRAIERWLYLYAKDERPSIRQEVAE